MFLIRAAFWFTIVILLIPGDRQGGIEAPGISVFDTISVARGAAVDLAGLCERQPEVCSNGGAALAALGAKARYGAAAIYGLFDGKTEAPRLPDVASGGTLTPEDMAPEWHAPRSIEDIVERDA
jgi:hypothetical protein